MTGNTVMGAMIDLETFGITPDACIVSIGAVVFVRNSVAPTLDDLPDSLVDGFKEDGFYRVVTPQQDRRIDADTVLWWLGQSEAARQNITEPIRSGVAVSLKDALSALSRYLRLNRCKEVWSHGASFDLVILRHAYAQCGEHAPYHYTDIRDTRTLFSLLTPEQVRTCWPENREKHHALADAACQALAVCRALTLVKQRVL